MLQRYIFFMRRQKKKCNFAPVIENEAFYTIG